MTLIKRIAALEETTGVERPAVVLSVEASADLDVFARNCEQARLNALASGAWQPGEAITFKGVHSDVSAERAFEAAYSALFGKVASGSAIRGRKS